MSWSDVIIELESWYDRKVEDIDGEFELPQQDVLRRCMKWCRSMANETDAAPPSRVIPDGEGGISFEWFMYEKITEFKVNGDVRTFRYTVQE